jgi:hypothetical protein
VSKRPVRLRAALPGQPVWSGRLWRQLRHVFHRAGMRRRQRPVPVHDRELPQRLLLRRPRQPRRLPAGGHGSVLQQRGASLRGVRCRVDLRRPGVSAGRLPQPVRQRFLLEPGGGERGLQRPIDHRLQRYRAGLDQLHLHGRVCRQGRLLYPLRGQLHRSDHQSDRGLVLRGPTKRSLREQRLIGHPVPARAPGPKHGKRGARPPRPRRWTEAELLRQRGAVRHGLLGLPARRGVHLRQQRRLPEWPGVCPRVRVTSGGRR